MTIKARFDAKWHLEGECWIWHGSKCKKGYGEIRVAEKLRRATHISLELAGVGNPENLPYALHSCDTPRCVNPDHLKWGTAQQNQDERWQRTPHKYSATGTCKRGHPLPESWVIQKNGARQCRPCRDQNAKDRAAKKPKIYSAEVCRRGHLRSEVGAKDGRGRQICLQCGRDRSAVRYTAEKLAKANANGPL